MPVSLSGCLSVGFLRTSAGCDFATSLVSGIINNPFAFRGRSILCSAPVSKQQQQPRRKQKKKYHRGSSSRRSANKVNDANKQMSYASQRRNPFLLLSTSKMSLGNARARRASSEISLPSSLPLSSFLPCFLSLSYFRCLSHICSIVVIRFEESVAHIS